MIRAFSCKVRCVDSTSALAALSMSRCSAIFSTMPAQDRGLLLVPSYPAEIGCVDQISVQRRIGRRSPALQHRNPRFFRGIRLPPALGSLKIDQGVYRQAVMEGAANSAMRDVLVAGDGSFFAGGIEEALRRCGHLCVGPAGSLSEALRLLETNQIDAAILDVLLRHGEKIYPAADLLAARGIPFAFVTAYGVTHVEPRFARFRTLGKP